MLRCDVPQGDRADGGGCRRPRDQANPNCEYLTLLFTQGSCEAVAPKEKGSSTRRREVQTTREEKNLAVYGVLLSSLPVVLAG